jgi:hypothetical protein
VNASEAEVLDTLWALEEMPAFQAAEALPQCREGGQKGRQSLPLRVVSTKETKDPKRKTRKKKDVKKAAEDPKVETKKVALDSGSPSAEDPLRRSPARSHSSNAPKAHELERRHIISFQMTHMADRLPPLSRYSRKFQSETWQCTILDAIDNRKSAVGVRPNIVRKDLAQHLHL